MRLYRWPAIVGIAVAVLSPRLAHAQDAAEACRQLRNPTVSSKFAQIPGVPTSINSAIIVPAGGDGSIIEKTLPEICRVEGRINPTIGFLLRLPTKNWNGKFMMGGCGSGCGNYLTDRIDPALERGYAVVVTDMGHKGDAFNLDLQSQVDFGYRSTHVTAVAAKAITEEFYKKTPTRNYFWGCSTGGGQAMVEAQLYPQDFEGIIAGAPVLGGNQFGAWRAGFNADANGKPILDASKAPLVHKAVVAACHAPDGLNDDIIQNPLKCKWDPAELQCKPGQNPKDCLSPDEVRVTRLVFDGPLNEKGQPLSWGIAPRGSESVWKPEDIPGFDFVKMNPLAVSGGTARPQTQQREPWYRYGRNPDLREFRDAGGKLILFHGWADNQIPAMPTVDYYETTMRTMGGEVATKEFFRLFLQPAASHCRYGAGGGEADWLTALENWVEKGQAPDQVIAYHMVHEPYPWIARPLTDVGSPLIRMARYPLNPTVYDRARPVFAYPDTAQWSGQGDPNKPESWIKAPRE